ncbi:MAG TPA: DUF2271 domain-containing protein [Burkholderiaceae bacterium]
MLIRTSLALSTAVAAVPALSAEATLRIQLPRLDIAEYHKPYVVAWIEKASDQSFAGNVALWYDVNKRNDGGARWLKDMRSWWRKSGHDAPAVDGITGATRTAGEHAINLLDAKAVAALPPGRYEVVVEAARENGGREVLRVPFEWPLNKLQSAKVQGQGELAAVAIDAKP